MTSADRFSPGIGATGHARAPMTHLCKEDEMGMLIAVDQSGKHGRVLRTVGMSVRGATPIPITRETLIKSSETIQ